MSSNKNKLITAVSNYLSKVEERLKAGGTPIHYEQGTVLNVNQVKQIDIKTLFSEHALFHLMSASVEVLVLDNDNTSETYNSYINSEHVITKGINSNGIVKVHNSSDSSQTVVIKISSPSVKK